jgi:type II secretory pathway pseudopilin PulG
MKSSRQAGMSALELVITAAIFASVMAGVVTVIRTATSDSTQQSARGSLDEKAWQVTERIERELRWAQASTLLITTVNGSSCLSYRVPASIVGGVITWSSTITVEYQNSNVDANDDRVVDEGSIVRIQNGKTRVLCDYVPKGGFSAVLTGASVAMTLTLQLTDAEKRVERSQATDTVSVRN